MKKLLLLSLLCLSSVLIASFAQNDNNSALLIRDETGNKVIDVSPDPHSGGLSIIVGGYQLVIAGKKEPSKPQAPKSANKHKQGIQVHKARYSGHLSTLEMGFNDLTMLDYSAYPLGEQGFMELNNARSTQVALNLFKVAAALNRAHTLGISSSFGVVWNDYVFMNDVTLERSNDGMVHPVDIANTYKKTKLNTFALRIPLLMDLNITKRFFLSAGFYGDLVLGSHTKIKFPKEKTPDPYINVFQAGGTIRGGYGKFYVYGNYSATNLFKGGKGPGAQPITIGLGLGI